jgi:hypothetical protein
MTINDEEIVRFFKTQLQPLLMHLYQEAQLEVPVSFHASVEGPRIVSALRTQGFTAQFKTEKEAT